MFLTNLNRSLDKVRGYIFYRKPLSSIREGFFSKVKCEELRIKIMLCNIEPGFNLEPESYTLLSRGVASDNDEHKKQGCELFKKVACKEDVLETR